MRPPRTSTHILLMAISVVFLAVLASPAQAAGGNTFTVNSTADPGVGVCDASECTLREAITAANGAGGVLNQINFNLPDCPATPANCVISPASALPQVTKTGLNINGTTQTGFQDAPIVVIDGTSAGAASGLNLKADQLLVGALEIRNFSSMGINATTTTYPTITLTNNVIKDNGGTGMSLNIGGVGATSLDIENNVVTGNGSFGIDASSYTTVNGAIVTGNTITGNSSSGLAIAVFGNLSFTGNTVTGNLVGVDASYTTMSFATFSNNTVSSNTGDGVRAAASNSYTFVSNTVNNNGSTGINASYTTAGMATFTNNTVNGNGGQAIQVAAANQVSFSGNTVNGNTGVGVNQSYTSTDTVTFTDNTVNTNGDDGLEIAASTSFTFTGNTVTGNANPGVYAAYTTVDDVTLQDNTVTGNQGDGIVAYASNSMTVDGNTLTNNTGLGLNASGTTTNTMDVTDNEFAGNGNGMRVTAVQLTATGNNVHNNTGNGMDITSAAGGSAVRGNNLYNNTGGGGLVLSGSTIEVRFNRIFGNSSGIDMGTSTVNATNNWWGCNAGPSDPDCDDATAGVTVQPWLVLGITADPTSIAINSTSAITGDLTRDSNAADTSGSGHIPDGIGVQFGADLGSIAAAPQPTTNGKANTTFQAGATPGTAHVTAALDNQTVEVDVVIEPPATTPTATPSGEPTPSPTATSTAATHAKGDLNCDGLVDIEDAMIAYAFAAGFAHAGGQGCPDVGDQVGDEVFGDVDCDGDVDEIDGLLILEHFAGLELDPALPGGCGGIGA